MIKTPILLILFCFSLPCFSQTYKKFRVAIGGGYAATSGISAAGLFGTIEPGLRVTDRVLIGLRNEIAGIARGNIDGISIDVDVTRIGSSSLNGVYYFKSPHWRPYIGGGVGVFRVAGFEYRLGNAGPVQTSGSAHQLGFYPPIGAELGHFNFNIDYNFVRASRVETAEFRNNYLGIRIGFLLGGGKRVKEQRGA